MMNNTYTVVTRRACVLGSPVRSVATEHIIRSRFDMAKYTQIRVKCN